MCSKASVTRASSSSGVLQWQIKVDRKEKTNCLEILAPNSSINGCEISHKKYKLFYFGCNAI